MRFDARAAKQLSPPVSLDHRGLSRPPPGGKREAKQTTGDMVQHGELPNVCMGDALMQAFERFLRARGADFHDCKSRRYRFVSDEPVLFSSYAVPLFIGGANNR